MAELSIRRVSALAAPAERVWDFAISEAGLGYEFAPWMRMTVPRGLRGETITDVAVNEPLGRAWLLFAGVIPFDYDDLTLAEIGPGMRFLERSKLGSARSWTHEREVVATGVASCKLRDTLAVVPRAPLSALRLDPLVRRVVLAIFDHRHKRLIARWGAA